MGLSKVLTIESTKQELDLLCGNLKVLQKIRVTLGLIGDARDVIREGSLVALGVLAQHVKGSL